MGKKGPPEVQVSHRPLLDLCSIHMSEMIKKSRSLHGHAEIGESLFHS